MTELNELYEKRGKIKERLRTFFDCDDRMDLRDLEYQAYEFDLREVERKIKQIESKNNGRTT